MPSPTAEHYIPLGLAPCNDGSAADIHSPGYAADAYKEGHAYIQAIQRKRGRPPHGARLEIAAFDHPDYGTCYEVVVRYDPAYPASVDYARDCESDPPETWAEVGMRPPIRYHRQAYGR